MEHETGFAYRNGNSCVRDRSSVLGRRHDMCKCTIICVTAWRSMHWVYHIRLWCSLWYTFLYGRLYYGAVDAEWWLHRNQFGAMLYSDIRNIYLLCICHYTGEDSNLWIW